MQIAQVTMLCMWLCLQLRIKHKCKTSVCMRAGTESMEPSLPTTRPLLRHASKSLQSDRRKGGFQNGSYRIPIESPTKSSNKCLVAKSGLGSFQQLCDVLTPPACSDIFRFDLAMRKPSPRQLYQTLQNPRFHDFLEFLFPRLDPSIREPRKAESQHPLL